MKKIILIIVVIVSIISCTKNDDSENRNTPQERENTNSEENLPETDWKKNNLRGKVKKIRYITENTSITIHYNEKGYITFSESDNSQSRYNYNANQLLVSMEVFQVGMKLLTIQYEYDQYGNQTEIKNIGSDGILSSKIVNKFDSNNRLVETQSYNGEGILFSKTANKFGNNNKIIETKHFDTNGALTGITQFDELGGYIRTNYGQDGQILQVQEERNDDKGNMIYLKTVTNHFNQKSESIVNYIYEYDSQGNWTKQTRSIKGIDKKIVTNREITYY